MRIVFFLAMNIALHTFGQVLKTPLFCSSGALNAVSTNYGLFYNPSLLDTSSYRLAGSISANHLGVDLLQTRIGGALGRGSQRYFLTLAEESLYDYTIQEYKLGMSQRLFDNLTVAVEGTLYYSNLNQYSNYTDRYGIYLTHRRKGWGLALHYNFLNGDEDNESKLSKVHQGFFAISYQLAEELSFLFNLQVQNNPYLAFGLMYQASDRVNVIASFSPQLKTAGFFAQLAFRKVNLSFGFQYQSVLGLSAVILTGYEG